jgi:hypothetical protein
MRTRGLARSPVVPRPTDAAFRSLLALAAIASLLSATAHPQERDLDVVLAGGRVMDPESGLDGVRHLGLRGDRIMAISENLSVSPADGSTQRPWWSRPASSTSMPTGRVPGPTSSRPTMA